MEEAKFSLSSGLKVKLTLAKKVSSVFIVTDKLLKNISKDAALKPVSTAIRVSSFSPLN